MQFLDRLSLVKRFSLVDNLSYHLTAPINSGQEKEVRGNHMIEFSFPRLIASSGSFVQAAHGRFSQQTGGMEK